MNQAALLAAFDYISKESSNQRYSTRVKAGGWQSCSNDNLRLLQASAPALNIGITTAV
ncbi:MAG TPA: hypothetical protein VE971_00180 [Candidatus Eisenbacteria bacterium]|nr:hypothetical protein [Candidatus Eisenbacteria bacterium]